MCHSRRAGRALVAGPGQVGELLDLGAGDDCATQRSYECAYEAEVAMS